MTEQPEAILGSTKPYLIRAIFDWCIDEEQTPQVMVDVSIAGVEVPVGYANEGKIVLNLHPNAVRGLELGNEYLMFSARFAGKSEDIVVPVEAVLAVYARENGQGIVFQADGSGVTPPSPTKPTNPEWQPVKSAAADTAKPVSHLKIVK